LENCIQDNIDTVDFDVNQEVQEFKNVENIAEEVKIAEKSGESDIK
jgi:hypothetical protein